MQKVKPIPDGMHAVTPHIVCAGAASAIEFYKKAFGAVESGRLPGPDGKDGDAVEFEIAALDFVGVGFRVKTVLQVIVLLA
jgi:uncharacterized glyoxalase superfamily protein PhnB